MTQVLIAWADGFVVSHLTEMLVTQGYQVKAFYQYNSFNDWGWLEDINCLDQIELLTGDIRDFKINTGIYTHNSR